MAERPTRLPRWAYDAPDGQLVEPPSAYAASGYYTGERPPAQWINYQLHFASAWADYLSGPGWGAWARTAHGGSAPVFTSVTGLAVDTDDSRAAAARYRYVAVGAITGPAAAIAVSRTGREWVTRTIPNGCTAVRGVVMLGSRCMAWGTHSSTEVRAWQTSLAVGDASAIHTADETYWDTCTDNVGNLQDVVAVAYDGTSEAWALTVAGGATARYRSRNGGQTWPVSSGFTFVASSVGTGIAWDATRSRYVIAGSKGDTYTFVPTEDGVGVVTQRQTLPTAPTTGTIHLRTGGGTCLAWASLDASGTPLAASLLWRSDDGGETWAAVTLASAFGAALTDVTYADGVWVATTSAAPYLWRSDDAGATWERVPLPLDESSSWALHRAVYADGAVTATGLTWTVATTRATGLSPDATRVYSPEPGYLADAGYLRGRRISATAPTDNQVLVWDAAGGLWTPETPAAAGMTNPMTTAGDLIRGGASGTPERVAVGSSGQVLTVVAGVPAWAPAGGGVDTSLQAAPDTGWTAEGDGVGAISAGVVTSTVTAAQIAARLHRPLIGSIYMPAVELMARVTLTTAPGSGDYRQYLAVTDGAASSRGYRVQVQSDGLVYLFRGGGSTVVGSAARAALWTGGTLWLRLIVTPGGAAAYQGVAAGPAPPSSWTLVASTSGSADGAAIAAGEVGVMAVNASRTGGTGTLVCTAQNVQWRSLLGAPT